ncbi:hypothetical protein [Saccharospirillum alexandrii]|uniref:hypothetical protein n=1 Tax=Saccharospirillum alexandrii TaxID=2448477 RepID=UPI000FD8A777|nr:hypothetical protein [Saccharospirillum alexandrii]
MPAKNFKTQYCFTTLALGSQYQELAKLLANDIMVNCPNMELIVLTDNVEAFKDFKNVIPVLHKNRGIYHCFHDKRFAIACALKRNTNCIYVDADCRIICPPPITFWENLNPGIHGFWMYSMKKKLEEDISEQSDTALISFNSAKRIRNITNLAARQEKVSINDAMYIQEVAIIVNSNERDAYQFLRSWDRLANFFQLRGFSWGEGRAIGLAAKKANLTTYKIVDLDEWLFKDLYFESKIGNSGNPTPIEHNYYKVRQLMAKNKMSPLKRKISLIKRLANSCYNAMLMLVNSPAMQSHRILNQTQNHEVDNSR